MHLIRGLQNLRPQHQGCALTIGNFDGVHLGHQAIIQHLQNKAAELACPAGVMSFEPLPHEYFSHQQSSSRLNRLREKFFALRACRTDFLLCLKFNQQLAEMPAAEFVEEILVKQLKIKYLLIGDDFRFGQGRSGDFKTLQQAGQQFGFEVEDSATRLHHDERISSTRIRDALKIGQLELAAQMLGHAYNICGRVAHGDKRGRTIGFPTANLKLFHRNIPLSGVYAVTLELAERTINGVANIGKRPTVDGINVQLEVHLFDFSEDIYGRHVCVNFKHKIREERKFDSLDALQSQIHKDCDRAKAYFTKPTNS
ncbi:MAG: bifunctional riboflavin kinase/FAD synthetase [Gammaproteobacteria bacterium]|nr:bifunctional riboflavin kinase/FAD synthetase [Gammaproteobacteria bacterium]